MRTQSQQLEEMREELYYLRAERMRLLEAGRGDERLQHQGDSRGLQYEGAERPQLRYEENERPQPEGPLRGLRSEGNERPSFPLGAGKEGNVVVPGLHCSGASSAFLLSSFSN